MKKKSSKFLLALAVTLLPLSNSVFAQSVTAWSELVNAVKNGGEYELNNNVAIEKTSQDKEGFLINLISNRRMVKMLL